LSQVEALAGVAAKYAEVGQKAKALEIFALAQEIANSIKDDKQSKAYALTQIAKKYVEAGQYDQALVVTQSPDIDLTHKAEVLTMVAVKYAEAGQHDQALTVAQSIQGLGPVVNGMREDCRTKKADALTQVAVKAAQAGQYDQAFRVVKTIEELYDSSKANALALIGDWATQAEPAVRALEILAQAQAIAKSIKAENIKAEALGEMATQYAAIGQAEKASQILDQALWSAKQIGVTGNLCGLVSCTFHI
jgi:tetratricopeptide (TPR) repeat protein